MPTIKFDLRESVPILARDTPTITKIAALIFLISYCVFLDLLFGVISATRLLSAQNFSISAQISADSLRRLTLLTAAALGTWAIVKGFLIANLFFRRRWAKNVLSVISLITALVIFLAHSVQPENSSLNLRNNLEHVAEIVAVVLLFAPRSTAWFRFRS